MNIIIIIPAFNEEHTIGETITSIKETLREQFSDHNLTICVIDDGSKDQTAVIAKEIGADRLLKHPSNMGLGAAIRTGFAFAKRNDADIVVKFDADLQHAPKDIIKLIKPVENDTADIVYGNRFNAIKYKMPIIRKLGNKAFSLFMKKLTNYKIIDSQPGIFAVNRTFLNNYYLPGDYNYTQQLLIDAYHRGLRFQHVDVRFTNRLKGTSFISYKYPFKVLPQIVHVIIGIKPMKIFAPFGIFFILCAILLSVIEIYNWFAGFSPKPIVHVNAVLGLLILGGQTLSFGLLAQLIVSLNKK